MSKKFHIKSVESEAPVAESEDDSLTAPATPEQKPATPRFERFGQLTPTTAAALRAADCASPVPAKKQDANVKAAEAMQGGISQSTCVIT